jgi:uncharacterized protein (TIGR02118 family)
LRGRYDGRTRVCLGIADAMARDDLSKGTAMIKVLSMMKRKEGMSLDEFRQWLTQEHVKLTRSMPGLEKFVVNIPPVDSPDNPYDSVNELYFKDEASMAAAFASEAGKASGADALAHISSRARLVTVEHKLI